MTPEEILRSLKSNDEWTVNALTPRMNPFADAVVVRTPSRARVILLEFAAVAAVVALVTGVVGVQNAVRGHMAGPGPVPAVVPTSTPPSTPTPTETPRVLPIVKPSIDELELSTEGLGHLEVGSPVISSVGPGAMVTVDLDACPGREPSSADWNSQYPGDPFEVVTAHPDNGSDILAVSITSKSISTTEGIHIGSTYDELWAAYDKVVGVGFSATEGFYAVEGSRGMLIFAVPLPGEEPDGVQPETVTFMQARILDVEVAGPYARDGICAQ